MREPRSFCGLSLGCRLMSALRSRSLALPLVLLLAGAGDAASEPVPDQQPGDGWLQQAKRHIEAREYWASANQAGLQAPNRRHGLRTYFEPSGIRVVDRKAPGSPGLLQIELAALARDGKRTPVEPGVVRHQGPRVEIARAALVEWYLNDPSGLEQGFTLLERPEGEGPLTLELEVVGATAHERGDSIQLTTKTGRTLDYGKLKAFDAEGTVLASRLDVLSPGRIGLRVDDARAVYPIEIDPLLTGGVDGTVIVGGNGLSADAGDFNGDGYSDLIIGRTLYDNGETDEGAAFIFHGGPAGMGNQTEATADTQLESNQAGAEFGFVRCAGDVNGDGYEDAIVGSSQYDNGQSDEGAAFVFLGSSTGISSGDPTTADAQFESNVANAAFATTVSGAGDVNGDGYSDMIVGSPFLDTLTGAPGEGTAHIFLGSSSLSDGDRTSAATELGGGQTDSSFGISVAAAGDVNGDGYGDVVVGASNYFAGQNDEGAAFVFLGSAAGIPSGSAATASAQLESDQGGAEMGLSASGAGDVNGDGYSDLIVGAWKYDAGQVDEGAAFLFLGGVSGITSGTPATADAQLESDLASAQYGFPVSGLGDVNGDGYGDVIVGAPLYSSGEANEGAFSVYLGGSSGIPDGSPATAAVHVESNQFGALLGATVAGGDVNGDGYADAYVFGNIYHGSAAGIADGDPTTAATHIDPDQSGARLGRSVSHAGDVNGDGYGDVIVGASSYDSGENDEGAAFVFHGGPGGLAGDTPLTAAAQLESDQVDAFFGWSVSSAGDVNGDGYADVIVGALEYDNGQLDEGAAFVFHGSPSGVGSSNAAGADAQLESDQTDSSFGISVAAAGDVNGDGYADAIVGASHYVSGQSDEGAAFVFHGGPGGLTGETPLTAAAQLESDQLFAQLGTSVSSAGDVNGDGYSDVIVGSRGYSAGQSDEGAAFVFHGSAFGVADGNPATADAVIEANQADADLGFRVAGAGDVNGDGYGDVIVGASFYDNGEVDEGIALVFLGGASGIATGDPSTADALLESNQANARFGHAVSGAGDVNGDGYADVIVGAWLYDNPELDEGAAFVFLGGSSGIASGDPGTADALIEANHVAGTGWLGFTVSGAGDVNGDGFGDVLVGSPHFDPTSGNRGAALVFHGNDGGNGRPVLTQQRRGDSSGTAVQAHGSSHAVDSFEVRMTATDPVQRGRVKLEVEFCPPGVDFGHGSCGNHVGSSWTDVTATSGGVVLTETISGLTADTLYRWRARVLRAPYRVTESGITAPPKPAAGPWRRVQAQVQEADIRVDDGDGISGAVEDAAPNGGDGNGDGTLDSLQADVTSAPGAEGSGYLTVTVSGACAVIQDASVEPESEQPMADPSYDYPFGVVGFRLPCANATVKLYMHGLGAQSPPYRKFGPTTPGVPGTEDWYTLPGAVFGSELVGGVSAPTVTFSLSDGALGDATGVDGEIVDPGGPVLPEPGAVLSLLTGIGLLMVLRRTRTRP